MKTFLLFVFILFALALHAQITTPVLKANFGVDGDLRANYFCANTSCVLQQTGNDDWFNKDGGTGKYVIDTSGASTILANYASDVSPYPYRMASFYKPMSMAPYSQVNGKLWLDALFVRDYHGTDTTVFSTGSSKNGLSPADWVGTIQSVPDKNEILDMMMHVRRAGLTNSDSLWFFGGLSIENTSGDRYFDFELYQTDIYYDRVSQKFYGYGPDAGHTSWKFDAAGNIISPGDVIFSASYQSGGLTGIEARIWVDRSALGITPATFSWSGQFDGASTGSQYGYASIVPKNPGDFYTGLENSKSTWAGPFRLVRADNSVVDDYLAGQYMEISVNLTKLGLDPVTILGGDFCGTPFNRMVVKTRASQSFTSALKDFVAPIDLFLAPRVAVAADAPILCATQAVSNISVQNPSGTSYYSWSTSDGHIASSNVGTSITVDAPGTYVVTQRLSAGCNPYAYDTVSITYNSACTVLANLVSNFKGSVSDGHSLLNWSTSVNNQIEYFEVERSVDGKNFETVQRISAKPSESTVANYSFQEDISSFKTPYVYYRLKTAMNVKAIVTSSILRLNMPIGRDEALIYPNPANDHFQLALSSNKKQEAQMLVYDFTGVLIERKTFLLTQGTNVFSINTDKWNPGAYVVQLITQNQTIHEKLIVRTH